MPGPGRHLGGRRKLASRQRAGTASRQQTYQPPAPRPTRSPASHGPSRGPTVTPTGGGVKGGSGVTPIGRTTRRVDRRVSRTEARIGAPAVSTTNLAAARSHLRDLRSAETAVQRVQKALRSSPGVSAPFSPDEAATIAKKRGATTQEARTLSTKVLGESGGNPKSVEPWESPGVHGLGLYQITTGVGNDDLINRHGGTKAMLKAGPNTDAALELLRSGGIGNWHAPSNAPGTPQKLHKPPKRKDLAKIAKVGAPVPGQKSPAAAARSRKQPFKQAAAHVSAGGGIRDNLKWAPGEAINRGINPVVKRWSKKYGATLTAGYDPGGNHNSPGHLVTGTATDLTPKGGWTPANTARFEKGLKVLVAAGFEVLYGTDGIGHAYPNHGRGNHAHVEWANIGNGWSADSSAALQKLGGYSDAQMKKIEATVGSGSTAGGSLSASTGSGGSSAGGGAVNLGKAGEGAEKRLKKVKHFAGKTPLPDLSAEIKAARAKRTSKTSGRQADPISAALRKKYGKPAV